MRGVAAAGDRRDRGKGTPRWRAVRRAAYLEAFGQLGGAIVDTQTILGVNATAVLALSGVVIGGVIAAAASWITQSAQRKWQLQDQRSEWKRHRLQEQLQVIIDWQEKWIRFRSHFRIKGPVHLPFPADQYRLLLELPQVATPIVIAIGDKELTALTDKFRETISRYKFDFKKANAEDDAWNDGIDFEISGVAAETRKRAQQLLAGTFDEK